ncbi:MAG TPA: proton-conducting transporter membrane subunit, partial [Myxococcota bacterium]|nr:proton-conducting transporter membrane subunit [Myxococcota bacterium]
PRQDAVFRLTTVTVKAAGVGALVRILLEVAPAQADAWAGLLWWMAMATMIVGNLLAAQQTSVKRMLAWSSVAHTGYVLIALASLVSTDGTFSAAPAAAAVFYVFTYGFMTMGAFQMLVYMGHEVEVPGRSSPEWQDAEQLDDLAGVGQRRPWAALAMTLFLVSLGGFPPTAGFVGKLFLFRAAIAQGHVSLAVVGVIASLVSLYYYLRVVVWMFMKETVTDDERPSPWVGAVVATSAVLTLAFGLLPDAIWYLASWSVRGLAG